MGWQKFARQQHDVRLSGANDSVGLMRFGDHPHRAGKDARLAPDALREWRLVGRPNLLLGMRHDPAGRAIHQVDAQRPETAGQLHGILELPAVLHPVDGRDAHEQRQGIRQRGAHRGGHFQGQPDAAVERAAILIGAVVGEWREGRSVAVEIEKTNREKILRDILKCHIYLHAGADLAIVGLPKNYPHTKGVWILYEFGMRRLRECMIYGFGTADTLGRVLLLGFEQFVASTNAPLSRKTRLEMRRQAAAQASAAG